MKQFIRAGVMRAARVLPQTIVEKLGNVVRELELDRWMRARGLVVNHRVGTRAQLFELVAAEVGQRPVLYLEFGVAKGDATRAWANLLKHPETVLHGFDSFEGLPETWTPDRPKGMFSTGGVPPTINDPRVKFFKGWFDKTLETYEPPSRETVIINVDADLYSSTITVLRKLRPLIQAGTYLYFDEFSSYGHEERAFREFVEETGLKFTLRGTTPGLLQVLFQCVRA